MPVSPADRKVSGRAKFVCRYLMYNPYGTGPLRFESFFEACAALVLMARRDIDDMSCQYAVRFREGEEGIHYFDLRVTYKNGMVKLFAVRPEGRDKDGKLAEAIEEIRNLVLDQHADECEILTNATITQALVYRAGEIVRARSLLNAENCRRMMRVMAGMSGSFQAYELLEEFGDFPSGWTALWNLMDRGVLEHDCLDPSMMRFTHASWLRCA